MCRFYAHIDVQLLRDLKNAALEGIRAFETHEAGVVERAGATVLNAARQTLDVVSAYYQRLAKHTRGHGIAAGDPVDEVIPADRGIPGHGGPLPLPD
jgi:sulfite reductase (NADPH) flavoprotein alpha-component